MSMPVDPSRGQPRGTLHDYLDELAGQVRGVDLRDRVLASSRRVRIRRRVATGAAAAVVAAVVSGIAWAGLPTTRTHRTPPAAVTSSAPPSSRPAPWTKLPAKLYYQASGGHYSLVRWDSTARTTFTAPEPACGLYLSPNGRRVVWVATDGGGRTGNLMIAGSDGTGRRTLLADVACTAENVPVWLPDSAHLLSRLGNDGQRRVVDVDGEVRESPLAGTLADLAWSPSGEYVAYQDNGQIVVARPDGTVVHRVAHGDETPTGGFTVQGVSDDGRRVVVGMRPSDPGQVRTGFRLVDAVTGQNVPVPHAGAAGGAIYPAPGNTLLVRQDAAGKQRLYLLGPDLKVIDTRTEPASLHDAMLLITPRAG
jgi:hypothetical protein